MKNNTGRNVSHGREISPIIVRGARGPARLIGMKDLYRGKVSMGLNCHPLMYEKLASIYSEAWTAVEMKTKIKINWISSIWSCWVSSFIHHQLAVFRFNPSLSLLCWEKATIENIASNEDKLPNVSYYLLLSRSKVLKFPLHQFHRGIDIGLW